MRLDRIEVPGEHDARARAWQIVRAAYVEREPAPRPSRRLVPALALGLAAVVVAVALTPPGRAVVNGVRKAIGIQPAEEALFSLPVPGRLLVVSDAGAWAVREDGSARLLGGYRDAACSPFGRFLAVSGPHQLAALEPDGDVRWKLLRRDVHAARWGGTLTDTRIAYISRGAVRVVAGDGMGDHVLATGRVPAAAVAWRPGPRHVLAFSTAEGVFAVESDTGNALWGNNDVRARSLAWSADATELIASGSGRYTVLSQSGKVLGTGAAATAAVSPRGHKVAIVRRTEDGSELVVGGRVRFQGTGTFRDLIWSPDGRWLAFTWPEADQLVLVRTAGPRRIRAVATLSAQFESRGIPRLAGWCPLPPS